MKRLLILFLILGLTTSCEDSYNDRIDSSDTDYGTGGETPSTPLDHWLHDNFTLPYNIEVKYRWDASELDLFRTMMPPATEKVQEVMEVVRHVWIDPYVTLAGETFIKQYCPKQFVLVGSASYNFDGTITLGTAEGGRKVVLYVVNYFKKDNAFAVKQLMHTIEHEFAHILHQNKSYPAEFKDLTPGDYTANWSQVSLAEARSRGFITSYAMASPDEDFVEMIAMMLVEGREGFEAILECDGTPASRTLIREKEKLVVSYFKDAYGIDFYTLQTKVQEAIREIAPDNGTGGEEPAPVFDSWGFTSEYASLRFDLNTMNEPEAFLDRYIFDYNTVRDAGYVLDPYFTFSFTAEEELTLRLYYHTDATHREYFTANFKYQFIKNDDGTHVFPIIEGDDNADFLNDIGATSLAAYFNNFTFDVGWQESCTGEDFVLLYPKEAPQQYSLGTLSN